MLNPIRSETPVRPAGQPTRPSDPGPSLWRAREEAQQRAQKLDLARVATIRVRHDPRPTPHGRYIVRIRGERLRPGPLPLIVHVGGQLLSEARFSRDGRTLTGRLRRKPRSKRVVLDYGFAVRVAHIK